MQAQSFKLTVPSFSKVEGTVYYKFLVDDFLHSKKWQSDFTYKQLEQFYETLIDNGLKKHLIEFPATPFWKFWVNVDSNDKLIEERRQSLEEFFQHILQNPYTKKHKLVVNFIKIAHKRREIAQQAPASPGTPVAQQYSPVYSPKQGDIKYMTPTYRPMHSPIRGQLKKAKSLYGFTFQNGSKRKQSIAAICASSMRGKNIGRKLSLNQHA